ncbi:hypothetical protein BGZ94_002119, partial [Podila epigama]
GLLPQFIRKIFLNHVPAWFSRRSNVLRLQYRPQLDFLPRIPNRGTIEPRPQEGSVFQANSTAAVV